MRRRRRAERLLGFSIVALLSRVALAGSASVAVDETLLHARITELASDAYEGRATGSSGDEKAARLAAKAFAHAGLKPVGTSRQGDASAPLDGSGYFQPYSFTAGVARGDHNSLAAQFSGRRVTYVVGTEFEPAGISGSGKASAEIVFAGYGIVSKEPARDDYAGLDLRGKIVLLLAGHPGSDPRGPFAEFAGFHHKALLARDRGAAAVLITAPSETDLPGLKGDRGFSDEGLPVFLLRRRVAEEWLATGGWTIGALEARLARETESFPTGVKVDLSADVVKVRRVSANVAGLLPGSDPVLRDEFIVVGAHLDHLGRGGVSSLSESRRPEIHPGADDNASGAAGVMALADELSASAARPRRSILFICFSGEELGLFGSARYVKNPIVAIGKTVSMFNLDMVGRMRDDRVIVIGSGTSPAWPKLLEAADREPRLSVVRTELGFGASDHQSFYAARVPVLFFFTGHHSDYHRPSDTADRINIPGEARILGFVAACLRELDARDDRPEFTEVLVPVANPSAARVWFGVVPDYSAELAGVKVAGVRAQSPARKAGLAAGDLLVAFGGHGIRNLDDYSVAVSLFKPGDVVAVVVVRDGSELTLSATLEAPPR